MISFQDKFHTVKTEYIRSVPAGALVCSTKLQPKSLGMVNPTSCSTGPTTLVLWHVARACCTQTCFGQKPYSE